MINQKVHEILRLMDMDFRRVRGKRPFIQQLEKMFGNKKLIGVEIGVYEGRNSKKILKYLNIGKLYLIDPYEDYKELIKYKNHFSHGNIKLVERRAKEMLNEFKDKVVWIKKHSKDAIDDVPGEMDFVYIDGNHGFEYAKEDMEIYYEKLKKGGLLAGHDIQIESVANAFVEFCYGKRLNLNLRFPDWFIIKKKELGR